ncbi:MAG: 3-deoxy-7-phosphoheptulonate synthase [Planctomycetota bacterium]|nr:3-deoxy-7-phosphoheptulonate synthase [Planctomycetota bacterium]
MQSRDVETGLVVILCPGLAGPLRRKIKDRLESFGGEVTAVEGTGRFYLEVRGEVAAIQSLVVESWPGVEKVVSLGGEFLHTAADPDRVPEGVNVGSVCIGTGTFSIIAGPCAVEDEQRAVRIASSVAADGADLFRGGAYKPRTSPYAFQGLGDAALQILQKVRAECGLGIVTEVLDPRDVENIAGIADMLQVGSRNMHNYSLLKELGQTSIPILLKRGFASSIDEFLMAAEYILSGGNSNVVLCERGIRCTTATNNVVLDLGSIPELKKRTHLPVLVDPSHGSGDSYRVPALARAAATVGADGILVEVHEKPEEALSDGAQALTLDQFGELVPQLREICELLEGHGSGVPDDLVSTPGGEDL